MTNTIFNFRWSHKRENECRENSEKIVYKVIAKSSNNYHNSSDKEEKHLKDERVSLSNNQ